MELLSWLPIIVVIGFFIIQIILPEIQSIKRVIETIDYIDTHKHEYMRMGDGLFKFNPDTLIINFDDKMMSIDKGTVFVCYAPYTFGTTRLKAISERARLILNQYENGKSYTR